MAIIRGSRLLKAMPLWESETACYYTTGKADTGWSPGDFRNPEQAERWEEKGLVNSLAVPVGYFKLPNADWVSELAAELTPWTAQAVEAWRAGIERDIWLTVLRVYRCAPIQPKFLRQTGLQLRVRPFEVEQLQPVVLESEFERRMEQIQKVVERHARGGRHRVGASYDAQAFTAETGYSADQLKAGLTNCGASSNSFYTVHPVPARRTWPNAWRAIWWMAAVLANSYNSTLRTRMRTSSKGFGRRWQRAHCTTNWPPGAFCSFATRRVK